MALRPVQRARLQAGLACLGALLWCWRAPGGIAMVVLGLTTIGLGVAWLAPVRYAPVQRALEKLAHWLVVGVSWCVLGVVYFLIFTPLGLLRRVTGGKPLACHPDPNEASYLQPVPRRAAGRFDRQF